jgi:glycogen debranching enzyme
LPGKTYLGMWGRDSAFMALGFHHLGLGGQAREILRRWAGFVFDDETDPSLVCIRHKGDEDWSESHSARAPEGWVRERRGAFPTNVYVGHRQFPSGSMEVYGSEPDVDAGTLWLYALGEVCADAADRELAQELLPVAESSLRYLRSRQRPDGLIPQGPNEDWADTLRRAGVVAYTQATLYAAFDAARKLYELLGRPAPAEACARDAATVAAGMRRTLLLPDGSYRTTDDPAEPGGVCQDLALLPLVGAAPDPHPVLGSLAPLATPNGSRLIEEAYPPRRLGPDVYGWGEYHNGGVWPWWLAIEALARARAGDLDGAAALVRSAVSDGTVHEWRDQRTGEGVHPEFATGAAALVWACRAGGLA